MARGARGWRADAATGRHRRRPSRRVPLTMALLAAAVVCVASAWLRPTLPADDVRAVTRPPPSGAFQTGTADQLVPPPASGRLAEDVTGPRDVPVGRAGHRRRPPSRPRVPLTGSGVFDLLRPSRRADASRGAAPVTTYTVEVERTLPFPAGATARHVNSTLDDPRGWIPSSTSASCRCLEALTCASSSPRPAPPTDCARRCGPSAGSRAATGH